MKIIATIALLALATVANAQTRTRVVLRVPNELSIKGVHKIQHVKDSLLCAGYKQYEVYKSAKAGSYFVYVR